MAFKTLQEATPVLSERFKNFIADIVTDNDFVTIIDWHNRDGSSNHAIRYVVDKKSGTLCIYGDIGSCIARWWTELDFITVSRYIQSPSYFIEKMKCSSDLYTYEEDDIFTDLKDERDAYMDAWDDDEYQDTVVSQFDELEELLRDALADGFLVRNNNLVYSEQICDLLSQINCDWWDSGLADLGRRIDDFVWLWIIGAQKAREFLYEQGA